VSYSFRDWWGNQSPPLLIFQLETGQEASTYSYKEVLQGRGRELAIKHQLHIAGGSGNPGSPQGDSGMTTSLVKPVRPEINIGDDTKENGARGAAVSIEDQVILRLPNFPKDNAKAEVRSTLGGRKRRRGQPQSINRCRHILKT
jgi:hypothetical protein